MTLTQRGTAVAEPTVTASAAPASATSASTVLVDTGTTLVQYALVMVQSQTNAINPNWKLLDSQSTISVFCNKDMLLNVRPGPHVLRAIMNG